MRVGARSGLIGRQSDAGFDRCAILMVCLQT
jgi:hypothetical protein